MTGQTLDIIVGALVPTVVGFMMWVGKKWVEGIVGDMQRQIHDRTHPIQREANGGFSLPDVARAVGRVDNRISELHEKINGVARDFEHLRGRFDHHIEKEV